MNKAELVVVVSEICELSKKDVERVVDVLFDQMENTLRNGESVKISGFGVFQVKDRKERDGTSPVANKEGKHERIKIPATKTVGFKPSKNLKESVR